MKPSRTVRLPTTGDGAPLDEERRALCKAGLVLAGAAMLPACGGGSGSMAAGVTVQADVAAADLKINDVDEIRATEAFVDVCRDADGIYAMSAYCTHAHCVVSVDPNSTSATPVFLCPCHGSTYDYNGQNQTAPAPAPLPHYKVTVDSTGNIFVDTSVVVDASVRVKA